MTIHPLIETFIKVLRDREYYVKEDIDERALSILEERGATSTDAIITLHQGFHFEIVQAENFVYGSHVLETEALQVIAYKTYLYMNYNPNDHDLSNEKGKIRFRLDSHSGDLGN